MTISFEHWSWQYAGRDSWSVRDLSLRIEPGERVAVVGASGAGKSTLLRAIAGLLSPESAAATSGTVSVHGAEPSTSRGEVGLVMQDPEAHTVMSRVGDDVAFGPENLGVPRGEIWDRVRHAQGVVGLTLPAERSTEQLSGGQRQRLALAGVLAMRPSVLLLDEPCANLDPDGVRQVHDAVRAMLDDSGATLVVVEHRIATWLDLVDRVVLIEPGGGVAADGPPGVVFGQHGDALTQAGVWVPGAPVEVGSGRSGRRPGPASRRSGGPVQLTASGLATARSEDIVVGSGIDLALAGGRVLAVTGPNGVGKSTLGLTLGGLLAPAAGDLAYAGESEPPISWPSPVLARRIGTVFQDPAHQFVARSVREELALGLRTVGSVAHGPGVDDAAVDQATVDGRVDAVLDVLGLAHLADADPFTLSGGEQRRLAIGTVLVVAPPIVVLDEPTSGQDRGTWQRIVDRLGALADDGHAVVVVTHDEDLVRALDADVLALRAGSAAGGASAARDVPAQSAVARSGPVARTGAGAVGALLGTLLIAAFLVTSLDIVSATTALVVELLLLPLLRVPVRTLALRMVPLFVAAPLAGLSITLYGVASGSTLLEAGFVHVTTGSLVLAVATVLRVFAIGLPAVALSIGSDPTELADGLSQILRLPARFVLGALTAVRMIALLRDDWRTLGFARRARGLGRRRLRTGASMAFALLVIALRRATSLALAMESRGFGAPIRRTWAREARWTTRETWLVLVCGGIGVVAVAGALAAGTWHGI